VLRGFVPARPVPESSANADAIASNTRQNRDDFDHVFSFMPNFVVCDAEQSGVLTVLVSARFLALRMLMSCRLRVVPAACRIMSAGDSRTSIEQQARDCRAVLMSRQSGQEARRHPVPV
jgi:hypothetical protein